MQWMKKKLCIPFYTCISEVTHTTHAPVEVVNGEVLLHVKQAASMTTVHGHEIENKVSSIAPIYRWTLWV